MDPVTISKAAWYLSIILTTGSLLWLTTEWGQQAKAHNWLLRMARVCSATWALTTVAFALTSASEIIGAPVSKTLIDPTLWGPLWQIPLTQALAFGWCLALTLTLWLPGRRDGWRQHRGWSAVAAAAPMIGMLPTLSLGHTQAARHHFLAAESLVLHVVGATLWVGGFTDTYLGVSGSRCGCAGSRRPLVFAGGVLLVATGDPFRVHHGLGPWGIHP
jgi:hypothetical protein